MDWLDLLRAMLAAAAIVFVLEVCRVRLGPKKPPPKVHKCLQCGSEDVRFSTWSTTLTRGRLGNTRSTRARCIACDHRWTHTVPFDPVLFEYNPNERGG